jgi:hypothetical protein
MEAIEISLAFLFICFCIYIFYGRKRNKGEFALLHLLKRITDKRLTENLLENELREIIISRDNIEQDNFDNLVRNAQVLDLEGPLEFREFMDIIARDIGRGIDMKKEEVLSRFIKRQEESNTAISDTLAIPHIVIEGENKIFLMIIRCKEGIQFTEQEKKVKIIFLLAGDNRPYSITNMRS